MKKLIALLIIVALCLSSCDILTSFIPTDATPSDSPDNELNEQGGNNSNSGNTSNSGNNSNSGNTSNGGNASGGGNTSGGGSVPVGCGDHKDGNNDGYCDTCSEYVVVVIDLYAINDLHGKVIATDSQPGIGPLSTYLNSVMNENSILFSSGDMWQGSSESNLTYGALVTDWMNEMGFVSMTLGNHEYDWGESYIAANEEFAEFPFLGINVYDSETRERAEYATPSVVVSRGGVEIGIIGAIGDCYSSISGAVSDGFYFKTGNELASLVKAEAERLRQSGVDFIVYSIHDGYGSNTNTATNVSDSKISSYYQSVLSDGYVDIVFEAHTHQSYILIDSNGVYHLQGGGENKGLSYAKVGINAANGNSSVMSTTIVKKATYEKYAEHQLLDQLLEEYAEEISGAYEILGNNKKYRDDSDVEQLVAQLYYEYGVAKWGKEYDIVLGGGFLKTRSPYNLYAGQVTYSDVYSLLPFDNELVLCSIKGSDLKSRFINTDNSDYYIYGKYDSITISDNATYYIVTDTYTSTYSYNRLTEIERSNDAIYARDLVADFVRKGGWA